MHAPVDAATVNTQAPITVATVRRWGDAMLRDAIGLPFLDLFRWSILIPHRPRASGDTHAHLMV
ncbi:hypothetical protein GTS_36840 [Gandjariella thermophila]|uniref:Uncharacterized protein n=1 Tax=Gandjariella thermophila TaxID=1931992 RepID=A0A4D4J659_9PSEU|nr:hypothetical protein GTS_36840 [Gandjariella thermophila]